MQFPNGDAAELDARRMAVEPGGGEGSAGGEKRYCAHLLELSFAIGSLSFRAPQGRAPGQVNVSKRRFVTRFKKKAEKKQGNT